MKVLLGCVGIAVLIMTFPAQADTYAAILDNCLANSAGEDGDLACRDLVYEACQAASGDQTTYGMSACLVAENAEWDRVLNDLWPAILADAKARDVDVPDQQGANVEHLLAAQRAWIAFRDAECANVYQTFIGGTIRSIVGGACLIELTSDRVIQFRHGMAYGNEPR
ncbi:lysozyme inhibitor LprI family protein [Pseudoruegeria sp. SK021]|uniref:lysozyme inhibitor LprI family protein n=1 Tax=Pseudoruegeria sp. SK021 TaxID=1933035 RepID=UPI000A21CA83|nr:lysozyme inhibitor LprI family protein [Pseudoruegeria sp. SK021]OSP54510.1 hypothetical protein BV911_12310 [Pseudoruegeria sp. SK021]